MTSNIKVLLVIFITLFTVIGLAFGGYFLFLHLFPPQVQAFPYGEHSLTNIRLYKEEGKPYESLNFEGKLSVFSLQKSPQKEEITIWYLDGDKIASRTDFYYQDVLGNRGPSNSPLLTKENGTGNDGFSLFLDQGEGFKKMDVYCFLLGPILASSSLFHNSETNPLSFNPWDNPSQYSLDFPPISREGDILTFELG